MENRTQTDRRRPRGLKKTSVFIIGLLIGILIWRWRYIVNAPVWLYRAALADRSNIYEGKTNGIPNRDLVNTARNYVVQFTQNDVSGKAASTATVQSTGIRLDPKWLNRHHPQVVDYNPFADPADGNFRVLWLFVPGCESAVTAVVSNPGSGWYDLRGRPCYDGYAVSVFMSPDLKPTAIKLTPMAALRL